MEKIRGDIDMGKKLVTDFRNVKGILEVDSLGNKMVYPFDVRFIRKNRRYYWVDNDVIAMDSDYEKLDEEPEIPDVYEDGYHILGKEYVEHLKVQ